LGDVATQGLEALARTRGLEAYPTPFLAIDLDVLDRNLGKMQGFFSERHARVRPHVKSHKCTAIARLQLAAGAVGVTCATTDEVAAMVGAGIDDVLLANVVVDALRIGRLVQSARSARVTVAADSSEVVAAYSAAAVEAGATLGVVVDYDVGMHRNGVETVEEGLALGEEIATSPGLELRGVMAYEGHLVAIEDRAERSAAALLAFAEPLALLHELRLRGHAAPMLTGSSSATHDSTGALSEMTDVQAGTYALMDANYRRLAPEFEPGVVVVASVLTARAGGALVLDAGIKRLSVDWGKSKLLGYAAEHRYTAEEHCVFRHLDGPLPRVGERVALLVGHVCTTMSLYRSALGCRGGELECVLEIDGRDPLA
jgi:D-serine deaminase-like pyridoxal phosphate-dependent protein